ncbi:chromatin modification-related protein EAF7-domain-containing protein [Kalaharituber pfeilii]|nr:chromatin modification-related protein EAF7-domain-containing protein [Kalaharituber pfeilii]
MPPKKKYRIPALPQPPLTVPRAATTVTPERPIDAIGSPSPSPSLSSRARRSAQGMEGGAASETLMATAPGAGAGASRSTRKMPRSERFDDEAPVYSDGWTDEQEITLFKAIVVYRWKPAGDVWIANGMHKHFRMLAIEQLMRHHGVAGENTRPKRIWSKLRSLYNLEVIDEREDLDDDFEVPAWTEFSLPEDEFGELTAARRMAAKGEGSESPVLVRRSMGKGKGRGRDSELATELEMGDAQRGVDEMGIEDKEEGGNGDNDGDDTEVVEKEGADGSRDTESAEVEKKGGDGEGKEMKAEDIEIDASDTPVLRLEVIGSRSGRGRGGARLRRRIALTRMSRGSHRRGIVRMRGRGRSVIRTEQIRDDCGDGGEKEETEIALEEEEDVDEGEGDDDMTEEELGSVEESSQEEESARVASTRGMGGGRGRGRGRGSRRGEADRRWRWED